MKPNIGLNDETRASVVKTLNSILADAHVVYVKTRNYHWNVVGPEFQSLHILFEQQYTALAESIDEIAERARTLGGHATGTMAEFLKLARLKEEKAGRVPPAREMVTNLVEDHEAIIRQLRADIDMVDDECHDVSTADFLTGLLEAHEKMAWMLRSFLEGPSV